MKEDGGCLVSVLCSMISFVLYNYIQVTHEINNFVPFFYCRLKVHLVLGSVTIRRTRCVSDVAVGLTTFKRSVAHNVLTRTQKEGIVSSVISDFK